MATLTLRGLAVGHATATLFSELDLTVGSGEVVGLVGPNGSGKSSLLRVVAGQLEPLAGTVELAPRVPGAGLLTQEPDALPGETVRQVLARRTGVAAATRRMEQSAAALARGPEAGHLSDAYAEALEAWLALGGADLTERAEEVSSRLGLAVDLDRPVDTLSGGQAARVGLAGLLLSRFGAYLLDEPTNDLDADGLALLEDFVRGRAAPVLLVSHDRAFLSSTVTTVVEIDRSLQRVVTYGGGYDAYLAERETTRRHAREAYEEYDQRRTTLESRARTQRQWSEKGARAATSRKALADEPDKNIRAARKAGAEQLASRARQTERLVERLEEVPEPRKEWRLELSVAEAPRSGDVVAVLRCATARRGDFSLGPVDLQVDRGDRIGITGPNGAGKSTLLQLLLGRLQPDAGEVTTGSRVEVGEVDQARSLIDTAQGTLLDLFAGELPDWPAGEARTLLAKFGLKGDHVGRPLASLSPGERTRAALALLQARGVNLLVLDEPTNHLDLEAVEQLEQALESYTGTLLLVTHDRRMLETVRLTRRWQVEGGTVHEVDAG